MSLTSNFSKRKLRRWQNILIAASFIVLFIEAAVQLSRSHQSQSAKATILSDDARTITSMKLQDALVKGKDSRPASMEEDKLQAVLDSYQKLLSDTPMPDTPLSMHRSINEESLPTLLELEATIDLDQAQLLDYLNGEEGKAEASLFGGSLFNLTSPFDLTATWTRAHQYAMSVDANGYFYTYEAVISLPNENVEVSEKRVDLHEMARRFRAFAICYTILYDKPSFMKLMASFGVSDDESLHNELEVITAWYSRALFPFLIRPYGTFRNLHTRFLNYTDSEETGIVMSAGDAQWESLLLAITGLRQVMNCTLPIEVHYGGNLDLPVEFVNAIDLLPNVKAVDLSKLFPIEFLDVPGYGIKPFAMLASSFSKIIFIDSDVLFFQDPGVIFQSSDIFKHYGQLFFHDRSLDRGNGSFTDWFHSFNPHWTKYASNLRFTNRLSWHEQESGVVVLDKSRTGVLLSLLLACIMNSRMARSETYSHVYGDKETFWISFDLLRVPYKFAPTYAGTVGFKNGTRVCGSILHFDEYSQKPFWWNGGILMMKLSPNEEWYMRFEHAAFDSERDTLKWEWETESSPFCLEPKFPNQEVIELDRKQKEIGASYIAIDKDIVNRKWGEFLRKQDVWQEYLLNV